MSDKQQSAVDMLFEEIIMYKENGGYYLVPFVREETINQAKELFKQQTDDSYIQGMYKGQSIYFSDDKIKLDVNHLDYCLNEAQQYFNETFKTESNGTT